MELFNILGILLMLCLVVYLIRSGLSLNYMVVESMEGSGSLDVASLIKSGGDGGRVGLDGGRSIKYLELRESLLLRLLQLPGDGDVLVDQLEKFKRNVSLEELMILNNISSRECSEKKMRLAGKQLKACKEIRKAINRVELEKKKKKYSFGPFSSS